MLIQETHFVEIAPTLIEMAGYLTVDHPLRAYDAVQLAAALQLQSGFREGENLPFIFLSADERLLSVAQTMGLAIDNPNQYS